MEVIRREEPIPSLSRRTQALVLTMALVGTVNLGCNRERSPYGAPDRGAPAPSTNGVNAMNTYDRIDHGLSQLRDLAPREWARSRIACDIDADHRIHAIRIIGRQAEASPHVATIEYALVDPSCGAGPTWRPLTGKIFDPCEPWISTHGSAYVAGVLGGSEDSDLAVRYQAYEMFSIRPEASGTVVRPFNFGRIELPVPLALGPDGAVHALARKWFPPPVLPDAVALRVSVQRDGSTRMLADPVPGTDVVGSTAGDCAIHVASDGQIHIVYDGVRSGGTPWKGRLWHITLDATGALANEEDLGEAPHQPVVRRMLTAPDGRLLLLEVDADGSKLDGKISSLTGTDRPTARAAHYFVDRWLQLHEVRFDGAKPTYRGPTSIPNHRP